MHGLTPSAPIVPRCECGAPVELAVTGRLGDGSGLRIYTCSACKRVISRQVESAEISCAREDGPAAAGEREPGARRKRNKLSHKNRWLISRHLVIALRRAGVVCDIVVADTCGNVESLPTPGLSPRERLELLLHCIGSDLDLDLIEADLALAPSPSKLRH
jgi:hypothetical protein